MGSYDNETQRTNPTGAGHKSNNAATEVAETEEVKHLKSQYKNELTKLQEVFTDWSEADLLFTLKENQGGLEETINRIMEGKHISQWGEVKSRKSKKEHSNKNKQSGSNAQRGHQRGGYGDRGRARGEGGRGGKSSDRARGSRRENGSGYTRPPRQQNGTNSSNHDATNHGKARATDNASSYRNNIDSIEGNSNVNEGTGTLSTENIVGDRSENTAQGSSWSAENPAENSWGNDDTDKTWSKENPTDSSQSGWSADNTQHSVKSGWTADNAENNKNNMDNITASRDIDKATDNLKNNRDSTKDIDHSKDSWVVDNDGWAADNPKDNRASDNLGADTSKNVKTVRSVAPTKSPVSHSSRTIPSKPKTSWAQIVKPESKPEPKTEPISTPIHKNPEIVKPVSPQITNPIQSPPVPKVTEPVVVPPQETLSTTSTSVVTTKTEEMKEYTRDVTSPEAPTAVVTSPTPVVNVSPHNKEVIPPGLHKTKPGATTRNRTKDTPVVMPSTSAGLERVGVQFGSLSISNNNAEESSETETQIVPQAKTEERSPVSVEASPQPQTTPIQQQQQMVPQQLQQQVSQQVAHQQATQQLQQQQLQQQLQQQPPQSAQSQSSTLSQSNSINRLPTTSQALPTSAGGAPTGTPANAPNPTLQNFNPSYFKQQQDQTSAAYLNQQQHHLGLATEPLNAPYGSYLPNQPPNQLSGFGIGPIQSIPEYNAMYPADAQRIMGYYDPTYGQASPVTSTGYQNRDTKYTSDTATNTNSQNTNQQTGTQQSTNQQGGQNPQQAYPLGVPYYPYYYMANQFPSAYQQSGYGQPFVNKSMYPMYSHPQSKPGSASGASPYGGYPTTPTTPNTPHHYSHTSNTGYDEVTTQMHHHPPSVLDYSQKPYSGIPPLNFLGNTGGNNPQPAGTANSNSTGGKSNNGSTELNPPTQYKTYQDKTSANAQSASGVGQTGTQQHQQPGNPNYYGQQQQVFNNYQHPQTHQYYPHQAHHQATNRNQQQQYWTSQS